MKNKEKFQTPDQSQTDVRYAIAFKKMKRIKGFYIHLAIYLLFNMIVMIALKSDLTDSRFWEADNFELAFYWGIGVAAHGASVFARDLFFGKNWEERKIRKFMDKDAGNKWE